jgi:hypothetical protein
VDSTSGVRPYRYTVRLVTKGIALLNQSLSNQLTWRPDSSQLGSQQLLVVVRDNIGFSDTLYPRVLVTTVNAPCSLSVSYRSPTIAGSIADLNAYQDIDTLLIRIIDPDPATIERHTIQLYQTRSRTVTTIDSTTADTLRLALDPLAFDGYDTVIAIVTDRAGHSDTLSQVVYYGSPPAVPALLSPTLGATGVAVPVTLQWQGSDPDGDVLMYDLYGGTSPSSLAFVGTTPATSVQLNGLAASTTYYWQVRARDWKSETSSATFNFTTR